MTDEQVLQELKKMGVIHDGLVYRMKLFTSEERRILRYALQPTESYSSVVNGGNQMMEELEMINFKVYGKKLKRT